MKIPAKSLLLPSVLAPIPVILILGLTLLVLFESSRQDAFLAASLKSDDQQVFFALLVLLPFIYLLMLVFQLFAVLMLNYFAEVKFIRMIVVNLFFAAPTAIYLCNTAAPEGFNVFAAFLLYGSVVYLLLLISSYSWLRIYRAAP